MNAGQQPIHAEDYLPDIQGILRRIWRQKRLAMLVGGLVFAIGTLLVFTHTNSYKASGLIVLDDAATKLNNFDDVTEGAKFSDFSVQTEVKVLGSPNLALQTIKAIKLAENEEYREDAGNDQEMLTHFLNNMTVMPQGTSRVIEVTFKSEDPNLAAAVVNAHLAAYLDFQIERKKQKVEKLRGWFEEKVKDLKADVVQKAQAVSKFRADENLAVGKDAQELVYQQISGVSEQLVQVQSQKQEVEAKLKALSEGSFSKHPETVADVVRSPLIQKLREQESEISQRFEAGKAKYGENHPAQVVAKNELASVRRSIASEVSKITGALKSDMDSAAAHEASLKKSLDELREQADNLRVKLVTLNGLIAEQETSQKLLDSFLTNYQNIQSQTSFAQADATIASSAIAPTKPVASKKLLLLVVLLFAGGMGITAIFLTELMRVGFRNFSDIRKMGYVPLGVVPDRENPVHYLLNTQNSSLKEALRRIYMAAFMDKKVRTVLVTSALPKEGRTTFVALMGHYLVSIGQKVLVVDADFLRPGLGALVGGTRDMGLSDVLTGSLTWTQAVRREPSGLCVINAGNVKRLVPDNIKAESVAAILSSMKAEYAYVLIDAGPALAHSETRAFANACDGIVVVSQWSRVPLSSLRNMFETLKTFAAPVLGVVLNKVDLDRYKALEDGTDFLLPNIQATKKG